VRRPAEAQLGHSSKLSMTVPSLDLAFRLGQQLATVLGKLLKLDHELLLDSRLCLTPLTEMLW
jgi:hypothetical protein